MFRNESSLAGTLTRGRTIKILYPQIGSLPFQNMIRLVLLLSQMRGGEDNG
jgi:hypothetical protein